MRMFEFLKKGNNYKTKNNKLYENRSMPKYVKGKINSLSSRLIYSSNLTISI